ncbi:leucine-rich repeat-containing protein 14 [Turdus rufiventris]|nr:leucine-rich repeat-containing protein 14 [Turdus rufiventris]
MFLELFPNLTHPTIPRFHGCNPSSHSPGILTLPAPHQSSLGSHISLFPPASNLQAPLESLGLAICALVPNDLAFLSQSIHASALKRLDLSSNDISEGHLEPLRQLLEETSASLLYLDLMECCIADSHLAVLLPTLLHCSCLRFLGLHRNPLSRAAVKDLLQKTLEMQNLHVVVYPYPLDCYTGVPSEFYYDFFDEPVDEELLSAAKAEISQLLQNSGRTDLIWTDDPDSLEDLDYSL